MSRLPMDLSKFRKVASDKESSTFRHYEGHEIKVAHKKLSTKMRGQLEALPIHTPKVKEPEVQSLAEGGQAGDVIDYDKLLKERAAENAPYGATPEPNPVDQGVQVASTDPSSGVEQLPSAAAPQQYDNALQGPANMPAPQMADPYGLQAQVGALKGQQAAQEQVAGAQGALGEAQAKTEQEFQTEQQAQAQAQQRALQPFVDQYTHLSNDIAAGHVDPHRYVNDMSTGGKIANAIGLILGGMGAGLTHGPNLAFQYLQNQIDRDVDAQKADIGKKENLLSHNIQMMGSVRAGIEMTRLQQYKIVQSKLAMEADKAQSPIAKANAAMMNSQIDAQIANIARQGAMFNMASQGTGNPAMMIKLMAPQGQQEALMKDLKAKMDTENNIKNMMDSFDFVAKHNTLLNKLNPVAQSEIDAAWDPKMVKLAHESAGRFNLEELPIMNKYKPKPLDPPATIQKKKMDFYNDMISRANFPSLEPYGVKPMSMGGGEPLKVRFKRSGS